MTTRGLSAEGVEHCRDGLRKAGLLEGGLINWARHWRRERRPAVRDGGAADETSGHERLEKCEQQRASA
jgi:hypothetical protein